jgi:hypothetical protein
MKSGLKIIAVLLPLAYLFSGQSALAAASMTPGASCQPRYGNFQGYLTHGLMGIGNNIGGSNNPAIDVVCPLIRTSLGSSTGPSVNVYVTRAADSGVTPLSCTLETRAPNGTASTSTTQSFSAVGEKVFSFTTGAVGGNDYYVVWCTLPYNGGVRSIQLIE